MYLAWPMYELIRYFLKTIEYFFTNLNQNCCITLKVMFPKKKNVFGKGVWLSLSYDYQFKVFKHYILKAHLDQILVLE